MTLYCVNCKTGYPMYIASYVSTKRVLISSAISSSATSTASARALHVGGGSTCFSHTVSISWRQSHTPSSSALILLMTWSSISNMVPIIFHLAASGNICFSTAFSFGLSPAHGVGMNDLRCIVFPFFFSVEHYYSYSYYM